jgi:hypothetical protein
MIENAVTVGVEWRATKMRIPVSDSDRRPEARFSRNSRLKFITIIAVLILSIRPEVEYPCHERSPETKRKRASTDMDWAYCT